MKIFTLLIITIFYQYNVVGQCKSITSYKYKNVDEVIIYSPLLRCSKGISDHVSHQFSNYQNNYFIKTSVELSSVRDVLKFNEMVYVYTLGNGKVVEKTVNKKHKPIEGVVSNSLSDVSSTLEDIAVLASLLGGGSYSGTPQQKIKYIVNESIFSQEEFEEINKNGISAFKIKNGKGLSQVNDYKYNKDFFESSKQLAGCVLSLYKNKNNIEESNYYKPSTPRKGEITDPNLVKDEINAMIQQKLNNKYKINEDFVFEAVVGKEGNLKKVKILSEVLDRNKINGIETMIENLNYGLSPALNYDNKPTEAYYNSVDGF